MSILAQPGQNNFYLLIICLCILQSCKPAYDDAVAEALKGLDGRIDYNTQIKPLLSDRCFACHGPDDAKREASLRLDSAKHATAELADNPGHYAIRTRKPAKSMLVQRITSENPEMVMPPPESNLSLEADEIALLIRWIEQGAEYKPHWSFIPPTSPELPVVQNVRWSENPIDRFVLNRLQMQKMSPAAPANKSLLLRRVCFDLTGLPPTVEQLNSFLADSSAHAYEKVVDELLQSKAYGEHLAVDWLDLARYADTHGYTVDRYRDMSPWRDWVIEALNNNMPYDQFVTWQLAGDLLPDPSREQIIATAFNRNHQQNMEGGIIDEEFRVEYVADRTNTFGTAFLGLTMGCARCHDHKYDPISQKEYYELFGFFNQVNEAGQIDFSDAMPVPTLLLTTARVDSVVDMLDEKIKDLSQHMTSTRPDSAFATWMNSNRKGLLKKAFPDGLVAHFTMDGHVRNQRKSHHEGVMRQAFISEYIPVNYQAGQVRSGVKFDGDAWLDLSPVGIFDRYDAFAVSLWINIPHGLKDGVIFHKGDGAALYNFRGYHLALKDNRLEMLLARTTPNNAIIKYAPDLPRDTWNHIVFSYDGSGQAAGLELFVNGKRQATEVTVDNLYKSILFDREKQPGIQLGARWRGIGVKDATLDEVMVFDRALSEIDATMLYDRARFETLCKQDLSTIEAGILTAWEKHFEVIWSTYHRNSSDLRKLRSRRATTLDTVQELMVMEEMTRPRPTYVLDRGQYNAYKQKVHPSPPSALSIQSQAIAPNRLGLASWLFHKGHPLTSRVAANRYWQFLMGRGLVETSEDFGNQGSLPSHPHLLDWLALFFEESGWDLKILLKKIVMSQTYRQSSMVAEDVRTQDVENKWYARGPSQRLRAEMLRDQVLAASGLLNRSIGGPSVYPYQPDNLWKVNGGTYRSPDGHEVYRRSLYTIWKRSVPHPTQSTFDAPERTECLPRRQKTTTPLQALILMNDPTFVEAAKVLASQMENKGQQGLMETFVKLTGRRPSSEEMTLLLELQQSEMERFMKNPEKMDGWLTTGLSTAQTADKIVLAANTVVASTIMNMDASIIKR